jgi:undecaprenyl diphosphate synthase
MGAHAVRRIAEAACRRSIPILTLFAFSSENWKRPAREIRILFGLFQQYLRAERTNLLRNEIRISAFGRRDRLPDAVNEILADTEKATQHCRRLHLRIALDYGARYEIAETARLLAQAVAEQKMQLSQITEETFAGSISSAVPDPDLIIRTAGERRLSNFLLWQAAYSEFYFCHKCWPDFDESDLDDALADFHSRTRRFGALDCAVGAAG